MYKWFEVGSGWGVGGSVETSFFQCLSVFQKILGGVLAKTEKFCSNQGPWICSDVFHDSWRCLPRLVPIGLYPPKGCLLSLEGGGPFTHGRHLFHSNKASLSHNVDVSFTQKTAFVFLFLSHFQGATLKIVKKSLKIYNF